MPERFAPPRPPADRRRNGGPTLPPELEPREAGMFTSYPRAAGALALLLGVAVLIVLGVWKLVELVSRAV